MNIPCDDCKKQFEIRPRKKTHGVSIIETYFKCPHCKKHYTSFVTNQEVRRRQREIRKLGEGIADVAKDLAAGQITDETYVSYIDEIETKKAELKTMMDTLKTQIAPK